MRFFLTTGLALSFAGATVLPMAPDEPQVFDIIAPVESIVPVIEEIDRSAVSAESEKTSELRLAADVNFAKDSAELTDRAREILAASIAQWKDRDIESITVVGHTDSVKGAVDNQKLSEDRAASVAAVLTESLPDASITPSGKGPSAPIADEKDAQGEELEQIRALNRRVEVRVTFAGAKD